MAQREKQWQGEKGQHRGWVQRWAILLCSQAQLYLSAPSKVPCEGTLIGDTTAAPWDSSRQLQLLGPREFLVSSYFFCTALKFTRETLNLCGAASGSLPQCCCQAHPAQGCPSAQAGIPWGTAAFSQAHPSSFWRKRRAASLRSLQQLGSTHLKTAS